MMEIACKASPVYRILVVDAHDCNRQTQRLENNPIPLGVEQAVVVIQSCSMYLSGPCRFHQTVSQPYKIFYRVERFSTVLIR
jgi:hypothetical protein